MKIKVGVKVHSATAQIAGDRLTELLAVMLYREAEEIMARSKSQYVPVDTGTLRSSGTVLPPVVEGGKVSVTFGYGGAAAPYALRVHENPRSGKTEGVSPSGAKYSSWAKVGQWKYLEVPVNEARRGMDVRIGYRIRQAVTNGAR